MSAAQSVCHGHPSGRPECDRPEGYTLDAALLAWPGNMDIQLDRPIPGHRHFALETHVEEVRAAIKQFFAEAI